MGPLHHLTLNTAHLAISLRDRTPMKVTDALQPILDAGGGEIPGIPDWYVSVIHPRTPEGGIASGSAFYQIADEPGLSTSPVVAAMVAWEHAAAARAWDQIVQGYEAMQPQLEAVRLWHEPIAQPILPWMAVYLLPTIGFASPLLIRELGSLEQAIAWSLIP